MKNNSQLHFLSEVSFFIIEKRKCLIKAVANSNFRQKLLFTKQKRSFNENRFPSIFVKLFFFYKIKRKFPMNNNFTR